MPLCWNRARVVAITPTSNCFARHAFLSAKHWWRRFSSAISTPLDRRKCFFWKRKSGNNDACVLWECRSIVLEQLDEMAVVKHLKFEIAVHLQRMDEYTFARCALNEIVILTSVDGLTLLCFHDCMPDLFCPQKSLSNEQEFSVSATFEEFSQLFQGVELRNVPLNAAAAVE